MKVSYQARNRQRFAPRHKIDQLAIVLRME